MTRVTASAGLGVGVEMNSVSEPFPEAYDALMKLCWDSDPDRRPNFERIIKSLRKIYKQHTGKVPLMSGEGEHGWMGGQQIDEENQAVLDSPRDHFS